jgi:hypothetical protein
MKDFITGAIGTVLIGGSIVGLAKVLHDADRVHFPFDLIFDEEDCQHGLLNPKPKPKRKAKRKIK